MGVANSSLPPEVNAIQQWTWPQVISAVKSYEEMEIPFSINSSQVASFCSLKEQEVSQLIQLLSRQPETGVVNALTMLASFVCLGDELAGSLDSRVEALFDMIDFDKSSQISFDQLAILFLTTGTALAGLLKGQQESVFPDDVFCRRLASQLYQELDKETTELLSKSDFTAWAMKILSEIENVNVNNVYMSLYHH